MTTRADEQVVVGNVAGAYGVRGWIRVNSFTDPVENILRYDPWHIGRGGIERCYRLLEGRIHGAGVVARLEDVFSREGASALIGAEIRVARGQFAAPGEGCYYWMDLIGLRVINVQGEILGTVERLLETGANDVIVVQGDRRRLLPYVPGQVVQSVDIGQGVMRVDWDADY